MAIMTAVEPAPSSTVETPERYGNIAVRVAGYSQMFKLVNKGLQDHIIARTKHRR